MIRTNPLTKAEIHIIKEFFVNMEIDLNRFIKDGGKLYNFFDQNYTQFGFYKEDFWRKPKVSH